MSAHMAIFVRMFETGEPAGYGPMLDEPEMTDTEFDAMVADLIAADPEPWPEPTVHERRAQADLVIAAGESGPVTGVLVDQLHRLDTTILTDKQRIGLAVAWQRVTNYAEARRGLAVVATVEACPDAPMVPRELHASSQLEAALGVGSGAMGVMIAAATQLSHLLPTAQQMALAGNLSWRKASSLATATIGMTADGAAAVEGKGLAKSWDRAPSAHDAAVRPAVDQV